MPRRPKDTGSGLPPDLQAAIDSMSPDELRALLPHLLATRRAEAEALARPRRESRRRPPGDEVVTYRIRVDLDGAQPPVWRRLEVVSDVTLDVLHRVVQVAMGWTDSHLHGFSSGARRFDRDAELYLSDYDIEEGDEEGVPEREVRLDEVLQEVGDRLFYVYDYGDSWSHTLRLEAVEPRTQFSPVAVCTAGRRACPPEDVGGVHYYNDLVAALEGRPSEVDEEDLQERREWLPQDFDPAELSLDDVNGRLRYVVLGYAGAGGPTVPTTVQDLLAKLPRDAHPLVEELLARAELDRPVSLSLQDRERMVAPYSWFIRRVGPDGVKLTSAGYLPPAVVEDVVRELDLGREWIGAGNREYHTIPVLEFRESAQRLGLVRKYRGRLRATARGRALAEDPQGLWHEIAQRLPTGRREVEQQAGTLALLTVAADDVGPWGVADVLGALLGALGWSLEGRPLSPAIAFGEAETTWEVLYRLGAVTARFPRSNTGFATPAGRELARAALTAR